MLADKMQFKLGSNVVSTSSKALVGLPSKAFGHWQDVVGWLGSIVQIGHSNGRFEDPFSRVTRLRSGPFLYRSLFIEPGDDGTVGGPVDSTALGRWGRALCEHSKRGRAGRRHCIEHGSCAVRPLHWLTLVERCCTSPTFQYQSRSHCELSCEAHREWIPRCGRIKHG